MVQIMKTVSPISDKVKYINLMYKYISKFMVDFLFKDIIEVIKPIEKYYNNDINILIDAIQRQQIQYVNGYFYGKFNAKISAEIKKLGGVWDKRKKAFKIDKALLPQNIIGAMAYASVYRKAINEAILGILNNLDIDKAMPQLKEFLDIPLDTVLEDLDGESEYRFGGKKYKTEKQETKRKGFEETIKIVPKIDDSMREELKNEYTENVGLSIKNFTEKEIIKLRQIVEKNVFQGLENNQSLVNFIQKEYKTTLNKAKFLARNETRLFVTKYTLAEFKQLGIKQYIWRTSHDNRVRESHKIMDGRIVDIDTPPVETGGKHAGIDYGCRCKMRPILPI